ncbi:LysR family transcriptional regulator [Lipingzhangella sp. LS1_29]|uniref:LysR family transcriptional regulator n=1 Tax=Lipingzhangella rawalii TaxID=2055835 RepID=A0ABU2H5W7_9ACTN|nr:LysR family transcriptional regulator [Lipingzhangella rawalii]MDS1270019.1 LysR family transcriptional regulator [Lipingzhangella rawalii]
MAVSLDALRAFLIVYRSRCMTGAADQLDVSQSAISGQIRQLERDLGYALFRRLAREVEPTRDADRLARRLGPSLDRIDTALVPSTCPGEPVQAVHLGGPTEVTGAVLVPALADLVREGLRVTVTPAPAAELEAALMGGRLDLVLSTRPSTDRDLACEHVGDSELVLVTRSDLAHRLGAPLRPDVLPQALRGVPIVGTGAGAGAGTGTEQAPLAQYGTQAGIPVPQRPADFMLEDLRAVRSAILAGAGVGVLPYYLCGGDLACNAVRPVCVPRVPPRSSLYLTRRVDAAPVLAVETVRSRILGQGRLW